MHKHFRFNPRFRYGVRVLQAAFARQHHAGKSQRAGQTRALSVADCHLR